LRGYGQTESPQAIDQFTLLHLEGDVIGLLDALGVETAVIAGHDWGAPVVWHAASLRPDRFRAVIGLSVPFRPHGLVRPSSVMPQTDDAVFYQQYFQSAGVAEAELEHDVRASLHLVTGPSTRSLGVTKALWRAGASPASDSSTLRIVTYTHRYKPPRKKKAVALDVPRTAGDKLGAQVKVAKTEAAAA
jgi:pimeloyl-ACP methyl ester carboxylesterase